MNQGMIKQNVFQRFELLFWNLAINVLSGSRSAGESLNTLARAARRSEVALLSMIIVLCGMVGLASGFLFFVVTH